LSLLTEKELSRDHSSMGTPHGLSGMTGDIVFL
jgi:hypothetical protein